MRLFAAVLPPDNVLADLEAAVAPVRDGALSWTHIDAWHVTLAFYGAVGEAKLPDLTRRLHRAASRYEQASLRLAGAGRFSNSVLWAGVAGDTRQLRKLASSVLACGRRVGLAVEDGRRFRPHVTLARSSSRSVDLRPYAEQLHAYLGPEWTATEVALVESHLRQGVGGRSRYETIATFPFNPIA